MTGWTDVCSLKRLDPDAPVKKTANDWVVSGTPWRPRSDGQPSLFCWALLRAEGFERDLVVAQHGWQVSIFGRGP